MTVQSAANVSRKYQIVLMIMAVLISAALVGGGLALYDRFGQTNKTRKEQAEFNQRIRAVSLDYCLEIESLKKQWRERALANYDKLDETLALLKLERTDAIETRAKADRDEILALNGKKPCPRPQENDSTPRR